MSYRCSIAIHRCGFTGEFFRCNRAANGQNIRLCIGVFGGSERNILAADQELHAQSLGSIIPDLDYDGFYENLLRARIQLPDQLTQHFLRICAGCDDDGICAFVTADYHFAAPTKRAGRTEALAAIVAGVTVLLVVRFGVAGRYPWLDPTLSGLIAAALAFMVAMMSNRRAGQSA